MIIVGFVEGASPRKGGIGLVGVPPTLNSLARCGHKAVLVMASPPIPNNQTSIVTDSDVVLKNNDGIGSFGIVVFKALGNWGFSPTVLWRFSRLVRISDFVSLHSIYSFPVLAGYLLARLHHKPYAIWPHSVLAPFQRSVSTRKKAVYDRLFAKRILKNASMVIFTAAGEREEAEDLKLCAPSVVIPHGIDVDEFADLPPRGGFRSRFVSGHQGPLVLFLARLNAKKGLDLLIEAMRLVVAQRPMAKLAIAGPPDPPSFVDRVRKWVKASGIAENVVLTGPIDRAIRLEAFADSDVFALPSHAENFGFSIFEAMASRLPVVVSNTLNYAEEISRAGAGLAVPRTPERFAAAIVRLLDHSALRRKMGDRGVHLARKYSWDQCGLELERAIEAVANDHLPSMT